jgi:2-dehydropantoate 2-reductase
VIARNPERRAAIESRGLVLQSALRRHPERVRVGVQAEIGTGTGYDILVACVQRQQLDTLAASAASQVMCMLNCVSGVTQWSETLEVDRHLWCFPAVAGELRADVLHYAAMPRLVQPTMIGHVDGRITPELRRVAAELRRAGIHATCTRDMDAWLKTHAAFLVPITSAAYLDACGQGERTLRLGTARRVAVAVKAALAIVSATGVRLMPRNVRALSSLPAAALAPTIWAVLRPPTIRRMALSHAANAPQEAAVLLGELIALAAGTGVDPAPLRELAAHVPAMQPELAG